MSNKVNISIIGYGYWGPNYCRIAQHHNIANLRMICDIDNKRLNAAQEFYPDAICTNDVSQVLNDSLTDIVIIATPVSTHADLVIKALKSNKHVLCEKPLAKSILEINEIENILKRTDKKLMCAHIFEFNPIIEYIKNYLRDNDIGKLLYISAFRNGLGPIRKDINVIFDLASHDVSIILDLFEKMPAYVSAVGTSCFNNEIEDVAFINLEFEDKLFASIQVSWLDPIKERKFKIVGSKKMLLFNDISIEEKLKIFKTGESYLNFDGNFGNFQSTIKDGDILIPNIPFEEPLILQFNHFLNCISNNLQPTENINRAKNVVEILEALNYSIKNNGERVKL